MITSQSNAVFSDVPSTSKVVDLASRRPVAQASDTWHQPVIQRLEKLVRLELGWDGYEGSPVKFENAVKFKSAGKQSVHVYDLNDDTMMGMAEATIAASNATTTEDISIVSPESGITVATNKVTVSGTTKKNHRVIVQVNSKDELSTTSNSDGAFSQDVSDLKD